MHQRAPPFTQIAARLARVNRRTRPSHRQAGSGFASSNLKQGRVALDDHLNRDGFPEFRNLLTQRGRVGKPPVEALFIPMGWRFAAGDGADKCQSIYDDIAVRQRWPERLLPFVSLEVIGFPAGRHNRLGRVVRSRRIANRRSRRSRR